MTSESKNSVQQLLLAAAQRLSHDDQVAPPQRDASIASRSLPKHAPYIISNGSVAQLDRERLMQDLQGTLVHPVRHAQKSTFTEQGSKTNEPNAGPMWFGLPQTVQTPEVTRDLKLLANRNVLDPHRHYKKEDRKAAFPEFSQIGRVIAGPTEFFTGRLSQRERKQTLAEDLLSGEKSNGKFNAKFQQLQQAKASGRNRHKKLKSWRKR